MDTTTIEGIAYLHITQERYAELIVAEDKYNRLCDVLENRGYRGLTGDEVRFLRDMLGANRLEVE